MNKKGLSILLALSMVFSLNTFAFAEEAKTTDEGVNVQYDQNYDEWSRSFNDYESTQSVDQKAVSINGTTLNMSVENPVIQYTGNKVTAADLGVVLTDTEAKAFVPVSKIKLTGSNKKADATGAITYKITGINNWKYVYMYDGSNNTASKKAAYKSMKTKLKSIKNTEFKAYIAPHFIDSSISETAVKTFKKNKSLSMDDLLLDADGDGYADDYLGDCVVIKTKNGSVKNVQIPVVSYKWTYADAAYAYENGGDAYVPAYTIKIKMKKLKKDKDYSVSGDQITFKDSSSFSGKGAFGAR